MTTGRIKVAVLGASGYIGGEALREIVGQVQQIDGLVREIAASAQEQSTGLQEVNVAVNQMDQTTQQNAAMVEQSTAASHALKSETAELQRLLGEFRISGGGARARPAPAATDARPAPSPARQMVGRVQRAYAAAPAADSWEEF